MIDLTGLSEDDLLALSDKAYNQAMVIKYRRTVIETLAEKAYIARQRGVTDEEIKAAVGV